MKPAAFAYVRPDSLDEALQLLSDPTQDSQLLAGGQSMMPMLNLRMARPDRLIDLARISSLRGITSQKQGLEIGAMTRYADLAADAELADRFPLIQAVLPHIAHIAIRNRGTLGGSLALADPAAEMPAVMQALDAVITCQSLSGTRQIPAAEFFLDLYETALQDGEMIRSVFLPFQAAPQLFSFAEIARRHGDYAEAGLVLCADTAQLDNLRLVWFGLESSQRRDPVLEAALAGQAADAAVEIAASHDLQHLEIAAAEERAVAYKTQLARSLLKRGLAELAEKSREKSKK